MSSLAGPLSPTSLLSRVRRGELWWVDWSPGRGSEQAGRRPALVVQTDTANENPRDTNVLVVTVSSQGRPVPSHVQLMATSESGLKVDSFAKCEQIMTISKERLEGQIGVVSQGDLERVFRALVLVCGP